MNNQILAGSENQDFVNLTTLIKIVISSRFRIDPDHEDQDARIGGLKKALEKVPDDVLVNGRICNLYPGLPEASSDPLSIEKWAKQQGDVLVGTYRSDENDARNNPEKQGDVAFKKHEREEAEARVNEIVEVIEKHFASAQERLTKAAETQIVGVCSDVARTADDLDRLFAASPSHKISSGTATLATTDDLEKIFAAPSHVQRTKKGDNPPARA